jgi:hypothetical protein
MRLMAVVSLYLAACVALARDLARRDSLAVVVVIPAILGGTLLGMMLVKFWGLRQGGPVLARLRYRYQSPTAWFSPLLVPVFALGYVAAEHLLIGRPPATDGVLLQRLVRTVLLVWTLQSACFALWPTPHTLALCQNGIQFRGIGFVPWRRIARYIARPFDDEGNLVIRYSGARIVAIVPPELRNAVEAVLSERVYEQIKVGKDDTRPHRQPRSSAGA